MEISVGILTISDRCSKAEREDQSGKFIINYLPKINGKAIRYKIIPDDPEEIGKHLIDWADNDTLELILTTGGTGLSPRDFTPQATKKVLDKEAPGISEMLRAEGAKFTKMSYLSQGVAGVRKESFILNLPGSLKGVKEGLEI
ncbi:MogA/MoaB family molybdenum cofactor biosynthesis protein, partial [bacterium]|nr:MogA/MoaB family molybdenum cofactor biosynthesis protein [bacterium]